MPNGFSIDGDTITTPGGKFTLQVDEGMVGARKGIVFKGDKVLVVSPAIYDLLHTDFEQVVKTLPVIIAEDFIEKKLEKEKLNV